MSHSESFGQRMTPWADSSFFILLLWNLTLQDSRTRGFLSMLIGWALKPIRVKLRVKNPVVVEQASKDVFRGETFCNLFSWSFVDIIISINTTNPKIR